MKYVITFSTIIFFILPGCILHARVPWENPIQKQGRLGSPLVETSPFVFKDRLYLLENNQRFWDVSGAKPGDYFHDDEICIRDVALNKIISAPLNNHGFGTIFTWDGRVYIFAGDYGEDKPWRHITEISMISSSDLKNWTKPVTVLRAAPGEYFFNTAVCRGKGKFVLLYETNDKRWPAFTFRYVESSDLRTWKEITGAVYGKDKYVGGPALYYEGNYYYTLYLESLGSGSYETRITRSGDLVNWEDAPDDRPFITFDPSHKNIPLHNPDVKECNASDVELCYFKGETILYFTGGNQQICGDLQRAAYKGTPRQLFEYFFKDTEKQSGVPPGQNGGRNTVSLASCGQIENQINGFPEFSNKPTPRQLAFQERQLGAFIHFGPASYIESDMLSVPAAEIFNPSKLDAEQWVKTAKSFGAKHIVFTAKHHNGYCLWPTGTTDYSVKKSPWKNGKGDVVAEFVRACRKYDMKIGLYISGGDKHFGCTSTPDPQGKRKIVGDVNKYFPVFFEQLRELLTNYGKIDYIWLDGAYDPFGWDVMNPETMQGLGTAYGDAIRSLVKHLQPDAIVMGGTKPDVRWSGSEQGWAPYPLWNIVKPGEGLKNWVPPTSAGWIPAEANLHTRNTWFWSPGSDSTLRDIHFLMNVYFESIGRGANLLINMTPDTSGLIPETEVKRLYELGKTLTQTFANPVGRAYCSKNEPVDELFINLPQKHRVNLLVLEENIQLGQFIRHYKVDAYIEDHWKTVAEGESIGRKRIQTFDPVRTDKLRLSLAGEEGKSFIKSFIIYRTRSVVSGKR